MVAVIAPVKETNEDKLIRLFKSLSYNERGTAKANGIAAASLRREIVKLMKRMEAPQ